MARRAAPERRRPNDKPAARGELAIRMLSHATLAVEHRGFTLVTDPWLDGPAFFGSWIQFPLPVDSTESLGADAVWISHEHSDHFHEPTLERLDRRTPVYVPDFPNRRLQARLAALGFSNVRPLRFGEPCEIADGLTITCFEPESLWNDAFLLVEVDGFRFLNLNDGGLNRRLASLVGPVDAVATEFSAASSGYPLTWTHLTRAQQDAILERGRAGALRMIRDAADLYGASFVLPFASHFLLWHPDHRGYVERFHNSTLDDVRTAFAGSGIEVVDLLPGETFDASSGEAERFWRRRNDIADAGRVRRFLERRFDQDVFERSYPWGESIERERLESYLLGLNDVPEIEFSEDIVVRLLARGGPDRVVGPDVSLRIRGGRLELLAQAAESPNLTMEVPAGIVGRIVEERLPWDEAHIGFWCRFARDPDVYHLGFWRLLHAPYYERLPNLSPAAAGLEIAATTAIADVVERQGPVADRILRRHGLYCVGCRHSTAESIAQGARKHGIGEERVRRLVAELNAVAARA